MRLPVIKLLDSERLHSLAAIADQAIVSGTRFVATILIGRAAGLEELGLYAIGFSIIILITTIQESLLMSPYAVLGRRENPVRRRRFAGNILALSFALGVAASGLLAAAPVIVHALGYGDHFYLLLALAIAMPFLLLQNFARKMCYAHFRVLSALLVDTGVSIIQVAGLVMLAITGALSAATAIAVMGFACAISGLIWLTGNRQLLRTRWQRAWPQLLQNWNFGKWILGTQQIATLGSAIVLWIITALSGVTAAGVFAACSIVITAANPLLLGISNILEPRTAKAFAEGRFPELLRIVNHTTITMGAVLGLYGLATFLAGDKVLARLFDKPQLLGHNDLVVVLSLVVLLRGVTLARSLGLRALGLSRDNFTASLVNLLLILALAYPLVAQFGALGGGISLLCGTIAGAVAHLWFFSRATRSA